METLRRAFGRGPQHPTTPASPDYKGKEKDKISLNTAAILARHDNEQPLSSPRVAILGVASPRSTSPRHTAQVSQQPQQLPALHEAVIGNNTREVSSLVSARNRVDETDAQGSTALHVAASLGNARLADVLIRAGASVHTKNHLGSTPLHLAALNGHRKVTKLLLKSGTGVLEEKDVSGNTPLLSAAMQGHFKIIQILAEAGASIMATNAEGNSGLHYAASVGDLDTLLLYVMHYKVAPDLQNNERATPLHYACSSNQDKCAEMLIEWGALPGAPDKSLATPLHCAAKRRALECVRLLLSYHVDVNAVDKDGLSALHQACAAGSLDIVERLIKHGANINAVDSAGETPLHKAASTGFASIVSTLIDKDAVTDCTDKHHRTPLYVAARSGHTRCVELFLNLQSKRNVNVLETTDTKGRTPLHAACTYGRWETTFLLLQMGALPNAQDSNGLAALHEAAINGDDVSMSFLVNKRCNLLLTSNDGLTALHFASLNGHLRCVQLLIEQGVAVDITDGAGDTPLHYAVKRNNVHVTAFLIHSKASVGIANKQGLTPLHYAVRHGAIECVVRLVEAGADMRAADRDKITPYMQAKREGDPQMRLMFKFLKKNNHKSGIGRHVFHDFRRLRAAARSAEMQATNPTTDPVTISTSTTAVDKTLSMTLTAKQRAAYAAVTKAPPALLSPKRVLTDVNFTDLAEVAEVVQSEASKQDARSAYAAVLRLLLLVPDDMTVGAKVLHVLEQAMTMVLLADPRKAARMDTDQFLDALRKKSTVDEVQRSELLLAIERALPQLFDERRSGAKTPRSSGKSPRGIHAISPRSSAKSPRSLAGSAVSTSAISSAAGSAVKPPPPPPPPPKLKLRLKPAAEFQQPSAPEAAALEAKPPADAAANAAAAAPVLEPVVAAPPPPPAIKVGPPPPPMVKAAARSAPARLKLRKLNWEKVPIGLIPKTVWSNARLAEFPVSRLTEEFQERDATNKKGLPPLVGPVQKRQIIELRRANQVGVLLAALKAPPVQIREMIMKGEDNAITEDSLRTLIRLVPKDEEVELLAPFKGQPPDVLRTLGQAEKLYLELMDVPRLKSRLEALLFRRTFPTDVRRLKERTQRAFNGINQLRTAPKLRQLLELILSIGNFLNEGTAVGQALGFRLEALQKLDGTRSPVKKDYSLMNFIVAFVMEQRPQLTTLDEELTEVKFARLEEINDIVAEEAALRAQVDSLSADLAQPKVTKKDTLRKTLISFEATVREQSRELNERLTVMRQAYEELLVYYAAERGADIAAYVLEFVKMFKRVELAVIRAREMQAAKERAKAEKKTQSSSRKKLTLSKTNKLQSTAPNLQVKLAMEGKPQTFANPLMEIDLDRVAKRRSRTLAPEITALLTARGSHFADQIDQSGKSPRSRNTSNRDLVHHGGMSRSPSLNSTRDAARGDTIAQQPSEPAPAPPQTTRKRMTLGRRVMNPILSIFSIGPVTKEPAHTHRQHAHGQARGDRDTIAHSPPAPLTRSVSVQGVGGSADTITRSTSTTEVPPRRPDGQPVNPRRKRRERPIDRGDRASVIETSNVTGLRASGLFKSTDDDVTKGKERMDPRDQQGVSRTSSQSASTPKSSGKNHMLRPTAPTVKTPSPPVSDRSTVDAAPSRQQFAKLRPVDTSAPSAAATTSTPAATASSAVATNSTLPQPNISGNSSPHGKPAATTGAPIRKETSSTKKDPKTSQELKRRSATFGVRLQPVAAEEKKPVLAPAEIQKERQKVIQRVRERTAKEQEEDKKGPREAPLPTPSAAVFPPELMQEVKVEDLLKEQFAGEKENALLLGEMPLLAKKRHSVNVTELFGLHMQRSPSQDAFASQRPSSARGAQGKVPMKSSQRMEDGQVLRETDPNKKHANKKTPSSEQPAEEAPPTEEATPVSPEALRQLKALYPHLLDSVLESLLRSADGDVEQATLYLQKKGWVSQEPAPVEKPAENKAANRKSAFSTLRNFLGGKKNPFSLPEQHSARGSMKVTAGAPVETGTKRKGVKF